MENAVLKIIFAIFLGVMIAFFVGFGIDAFYPQPVYPTELQTLYNSIANSKVPTEDVQAQITQLETAYQVAQQTHNRIVSIVVTIAAVIFLGLSLLLEKKNKVMTNGVMLGGLFTLFYGTALGMGTQDSMITFITVGVGLLAVVLLGLRRFSHAREERDAAVAAQTSSKRKPAAKTRGESRD